MVPLCMEEKNRDEGERNGGNNSDKDDDCQMMRIKFMEKWK